MDQHDHGPMLNAELPERLIELVLDGDAQDEEQLAASRANRIGLEELTGARGHDPSGVQGNRDARDDHCRASVAGPRERDHR